MDAHQLEIRIRKESTFPLDYHFRGGREAMRPLYDELIGKLQEELDFEYKIGKAYIGLIHTLVFAAFRIQTKKIIVEFTARKEFSSPRFTRVLRFQKERWAYFLNIREPEDIDGELIDWIKQSHE